MSKYPVVLMSCAAYAGPTTGQLKEPPKRTASIAIAVPTPQWATLLGTAESARKSDGGAAGHGAGGAWGGDGMRTQPHVYVTVNVVAAVQFTPDPA